MSDLRAIGWRYSDDITNPGWVALAAAHPNARPARVTEQHRSGYILAEGPSEGYTAESPPQWQRPPSYKKGKLPPEARAAVGDWVLVEGDGASALIVALLPRYSAIKRAAAGEHYQQQLIAANIDTVFVVCGLDADFNLRRIERYLLLVQGSGATPVVVLTKLDKTHDPEVVRKALADIGMDKVAVVAVNAKDRDSVAQLDPWLPPGHSIVLVGSSGAGKSTLANTLLGVEKMKTGAVRTSDERGRHTTTHRALIPMPTGACLIDTPGMRELKPTGEEVVEQNFSDIEALAAQCRFRDCKHAGEPGCTVCAAIESGTLDRERYANYAKLRDEVAVAADKLANRRAGKANEKVQGKASSKRLDEKYDKH